MAELTGMVGFAPPISQKNASRQRTLKVELIATAALAVSLVIAATAVSIGVARAHALATVGNNHVMLVAIAGVRGAAPIKSATGVRRYSALMPAALMIGHHFSISALL